MGTNYIAPIWRMPRNANNAPVDKLSNYSINFSGVNELININPGASSTVDLTSFTISTWVKWANSANSYGTAIKLSTSGDDIWLYVGRSTSLNFGIRFYLGSTPLDDPDFLPVDEWVHIVATFKNDSNSMKIYVNGQEKIPFTANKNPGLWNTTNSNQIGASGSSGERMQGSLSQICLFDYALSDSQINYLYNLNNPMAITGAEPVAYWPLGDNSNPNANAGYPNISVGADSVFNFDGSDEIEVQNIGNLFSGITNFSFSGWFNLATFNYIQIINILDGSNAKFGINMYANQLRFNVYPGVAWIADLQNITSTNTWFHYAGVFDGSGATNTDRLKLYINGQPRTVTYFNSPPYTDTPSSFQTMPANAYISIGGALSPFNGMNGKASNIQLWTSSLIPSEIETLYNNGQPLMTGAQPQEANLVAWYKLNQTESYWDVGGNGAWTFNNAALN